MLRKQKNKRPADWRILKRREIEERVDKLNVGLEQRRKHNIMAEWENVTHARVQALNVKQKYEQLRAKAGARLLERRRKLADLLNAEDAALKAELEGRLIGYWKRSLVCEERVSDSTSCNVFARGLPLACCRGFRKRRRQAKPLGGARYVVEESARGKAAGDCRTQA